MNIKKVAVIGSGTMGCGIAAQVANAGIPVYLLDLPVAEGSRNQIVENAKEKILKSRKKIGSPPKRRPGQSRQGIQGSGHCRIQKKDWI